MTEQFVHYPLPLRFDLCDRLSTETTGKIGRPRCQSSVHLPVHWEMIFLVVQTMDYQVGGFDE